MYKIPWWKTKEVNEDFVYYLYTLISLFSYTYTHSGVKIWKKCNLGNISCIFFHFYLTVMILIEPKSATKLKTTTTTAAFLW